MNNFALTLKMRLRVKKKLHSPDGPVDIVRCVAGLLDLKVRVTETDRRLSLCCKSCLLLINRRSL